MDYNFAPGLTIIPIINNMINGIINNGRSVITVNSLDSKYDRTEITNEYISFLNQRLGNKNKIFIDSDSLKDIFQYIEKFIQLGIIEQIKMQVVFNDNNLYELKGIFEKRYDSKKIEHKEEIHEILVLNLKGIEKRLPKINTFDNESILKRIYFLKSKFLENEYILISRPIKEERQIIFEYNGKTYGIDTDFASLLSVYTNILKDGCEQLGNLDIISYFNERIEQYIVKSIFIGGGINNNNKNNIFQNLFFINYPYLKSKELVSGIISGDKNSENILLYLLLTNKKTDKNIDMIKMYKVMENYDKSDLLKNNCLENISRKIGIANNINKKLISLLSNK